MPENFISVQTRVCQALIWTKKSFLEVSAILDVRHCPKLESYAISRENNDANLRNWHKNLISGPIFGPHIFFLSFTYSNS